MYVAHLSPPPSLRLSITVAMARFHRCRAADARNCLIISSVFSSIIADSDALMNPW